FVTFFAGFAAFPGPFPLAALMGFLAAFLAPLAALRAVLAGFLATFAGLAFLAEAFLAAAFAATLASVAPMAARIRLISRVDFSMVIIPSTVKSFRRSE